MQRRSGAVARWDGSCYTCGKPGLRWTEKYNYSTGKNENMLVDTDGVPHLCDGALSTSDLDAAKTTLRAMLMENARNTVREIQDTASQTSSSMLVSVQNAQSEMQQTLDLSLARVPSLVARVVRDLVPVEHHLVVRYEYSNGTHSNYTIKGLRPHKLQNRLTDRLHHRHHTYLVGPAGGGKTTAAQIAADAINLQYYEYCMDPTVGRDDLLGFKTASGTFTDGFLYKPFKEGGLVMLDEFDNSDPSAVVGINNTSSGTAFTFPNGERVTKHPDFVLVVGANTFGRGADRVYVGRNQLDAATLTRFNIISWDYDEEAEAEWAGVDQIRWVRYVQALRKVVESHRGAMRVVISPRASIRGAQLLREGTPAEEVLEELVINHMGADDWARLESSVGRFTVVEGAQL